MFGEGCLVLCDEPQVLFVRRAVVRVYREDPHPNAKNALVWGTRFNEQHPF
jgi:hypothetical protein